MDSKSIVGNSVIPEMVKYWRWISNDILGVVGNSSVYHISIANV